MILPHGKELVAFLPLSDLYDHHQFHRRLQVFVEKGRECVVCGREGTLLIVLRSMKRHGEKDVSGSLYIDLFTDDFVLMTVDHIIPKKVCKELELGFGIMESLDNKQPMCEHCNGSKGHRLLNEQDEAALRKNMLHNKTQRKKFKGNESLVMLIPNIKKMLGQEV